MESELELSLKKINELDNYKNINDTYKEVIFKMESELELSLKKINELDNYKNTNETYKEVIFKMESELDNSKNTNEEKIKQLNQELVDLHYLNAKKEKELLNNNQTLNETYKEVIFKMESEFELSLTKMINENKNQESELEISKEVILKIESELELSLKTINDLKTELDNSKNINETYKHLIKNIPMIDNEEKIKQLNQELVDLKDLNIKKEEEILKTNQNLEETNNDLKSSRDNVNKLTVLIENAQSVNNDNTDLIEMANLISELTKSLKKLSDELSEQKKLTDDYLNENFTLKNDIIKKLVFENNSILEEELKNKNIIKLIELDLSSEKEISLSYKDKYLLLNQELITLSDAYVELRSSYSDLDNKNNFQIAKFSDLNLLFKELTSKISQISIFDLKPKILSKITELVKIESSMNNLHINFIKGKMTDREFIEKGTELQNIKTETQKNIDDILDYIKIIINV